MCLVVQDLEQAVLGVSEWRCLAHGILAGVEAGACLLDPMPNTVVTPDAEEMRGNSLGSPARPPSMRAVPMCENVPYETDTVFALAK